jgi:hypothetical protein
LARTIHARFSAKFAGYPGCKFLKNNSVKKNEMTAGGMQAAVSPMTEEEYNHHLKSAPTPREFLLVFTEKCPCYNEALPACPLCALRSCANPAERLEKLTAMSDEQVDELYRQHLQCIKGVCGA